MKTKNKIPEDWERKKFKDIIKSSMSGDWGSKESFKDSIKCRVIRGTDIPNVTSSRISGTPVRFVERKKFERKVPKDKQFLIEISGGSKDQPTGRIAMISPSEFKENVFYSNFMKLVDINKEIIPSYFFYFWNFLYNSPRFVIHENRTTNIRNFRFNQFISNEDIYFPKSLEEQKAIAKILSTVDEAIEKTDKIIEKVERVKKGVMNKLLNKGEETKIEDKFSLEYGRGLVEKERTDGDFPVYGSNGIIGYHDNFLIKGPGIIVGRKGSIGEISWTENNFWPIDTTYYIRLKETGIDLKWLFYKLSTLNLKKLNMATGTPGLNRDLVHFMKINIPSYKEQQRIAKILSTIDQKLEHERQRKQKLERVKKGLMQDLLTGKKRVNVNKVLEVGE